MLDKTQLINVPYHMTNIDTTLFERVQAPIGLGGDLSKEN